LSLRKIGALIQHRGRKLFYQYELSKIITLFVFIDFEDILIVGRHLVGFAEKEVD